MEVGLEGCLDMSMLCACCLFICALKVKHTHTHTSIYKLYIIVNIVQFTLDIILCTDFFQKVAIRQFLVLK